MHTTQEDQEHYIRIGDKVQIWFDQVSDTFPLPRARMA